jgi:hypothetical protein
MNEHVKEVAGTVDRLFISQYNALFNEYLTKVEPHTRELVRRNKELNELYDIILDFIIDSSHHLGYTKK